MITSGGPIFWILLVMAFIALVIFFERLLDLRRAQIDYEDFLKGVINILESGNDAEALAVCEETNAPVAHVVATAIRHRADSSMALRDAVDSQGRVEIGRLDRRMASLAIIVQIAPLVGLFGTVVGFIRTLLAVNGTELVSRPELLSTAMEAFYSAAAGLAVAVLVSVMYGTLRIRLDRTVVDLEASASQILGYLSNVRDGSREASR